MLRPKLVLFCAAATLLGACALRSPAASPRAAADARAFVPDDGHASIYVLRDSGQGNQDLGVEINEHRMGHLAVGDYFVFAVVPGQHRVTVSTPVPNRMVPMGTIGSISVTGRGTARDYLSLVAEPGALHFFSASIEWMGERVVLTKLDEPAGRDAVLDAELREPSLASVDTTFGSGPLPPGEVRVEKLFESAELLRRQVGKVAVPRVAGAGVDEATTKVLSEICATQATRMLRHSVVSDADIETMLSAELRKDLVGCEAVACMTEIGGALGVDAIVSVKIGRLGSAYHLTATVVDIVKSEPLIRAEVTVDADAELARAAENLVRGLLLPIAR